MLIISHRGNLNGPDLNFENSPKKIEDCLFKGFDVEIDIWFSKKVFWLGHDEPQYKMPLNYFNNSKIWYHCKNIKTFRELLNLDVNAFYHTHEDFVLTTRGFMWTEPGKELTDKSICVLPEKTNQDFSIAYGICTDYVNKFKE